MNQLKGIIGQYFRIPTQYRFHQYGTSVSSHESKHNLSTCLSFRNERLALLSVRPARKIEQVCNACQIEMIAWHGDQISHLQTIEPDDYEKHSLKIDHPKK